MDDSAKGIYYMILGKYILKPLVPNLKLSDHVIEVDDGTSKGSSAIMVYLGTHEFKYLNIGKITPTELFINDYSEKVSSS